MDSIGVLRVCVLVLLFVLAMGALLVILRDGVFKHQFNCFAAHGSPGCLMPSLNWFFCKLLVAFPKNSGTVSRTYLPSLIGACGEFDDES